MSGRTPTMPDFTKPVDDADLLLEHGTPGEPNYPHGKGTHAPKLNKSEQALIARAKRNPSGVVGVDFGYQGSSGRGRSRAFGAREQAAAMSLMKKGLLVRVGEPDNGTPLYSKTGWGVNGRVFSSVWKLVDPNA